MPIAIKMPALSPTMEEGTLAKWLVKVGDTVSSGDIMAEIETDKATMEFEAVDEGVIAHIQVEEGTEGVAVGTVIATLAEDGEDADSVEPAGGDAAAASDKEEEAEPEKDKADDAEPEKEKAESAEKDEADEKPAPTPAPKSSGSAKESGDRVIASPLARRIAEDKGVDLSSVKGSGPNGRIVKADVEGADAPAEAKKSTDTAKAEEAPATEKAPTTGQDFGIPHEVEKLSGMRKTIARRLTESKQTVPHIYLTVDIRLDALLKLRSELNAALEPQGIKLSVNDLMIKALGKSLEAVPACNVQFAGDSMLKFSRADVSVAVSIPNGLITPIITDAAGKGMSKISAEMKDLAGRAKEGKLAPEEYVGGTASLSNMGMFGIKQFEAVINPPQGMIMAIGAGDKRAYVVDDSLQIASVMSATGSFDHRAIDGADGAQLMKTFKEMIEAPLGLVA